MYCVFVRVQLRQTLFCGTYRKFPTREEAVQTATRLRSLNVPAFVEYAR